MPASPDTPKNDTYKKKMEEDLQWKPIAFTSLTQEFIAKKACSIGLREYRQCLSTQRLSREQNHIPCMFEEMRYNKCTNFTAPYIMNSFCRKHYEGFRDAFWHEHSAEELDSRMKLMAKCIKRAPITDAPYVRKIE